VAALREMLDISIGCPAAEWALATCYNNVIILE
jgi:hypothetical protein